jgi:N6-L-threonylcarbamoyladenine synthase
VIILGLETSCDETACAVVENGTTILSNVVASSQDIHAKYGGIIPENAAREQAKAMIPVLKEALALSAVEGSTIDAIAVTVGPGLIGSLLIGVETAKALAFAWNKPLVPVNHLVGHIYANWLKPENSENSESQKIRRSDRSENLKLQNSEFSDRPSFPNIVLLVSGGHTELILMTGHGKFEYLGGTRDDAAGECFDKGARLLNLGYPGGPAISAAADESRIKNQESGIKLPRPMIYDKGFDFSFSGLKTAVLNLTANRSPLNASAVAYELQEAITDVLVAKTLRAAQNFKVKNILLAGGVVANKKLREKFQFQISNFKFQIKLCVPPPSLCTDNAAYIASAAFFNYHPVPWQKVDADPSLDI